MRIDLLRAAPVGPVQQGLEPVLERRVVLLKDRDFFRHRDELLVQLVDREQQGGWVE